MTTSRTLRQTLLASLLAFALALAGCSDDSDDSGDDTPAADDMPGDDGMGDAGMTEPEPEPAPLPVYINGTVTGAVDCQLGPENAAMGDTQTVSPDMTNRTYTLDVIGGNTSPVGFALCLVWAPGGETGNTGTVPADATGVTVYADGGESVQYSIAIV